MSAGRKNERYATIDQRVRHRPAFESPQIDVENCEIESTARDAGKRVLDIIGCPRCNMPEAFHEILKHHRDQRLILDDKY